jgi:hypothetical protein
MKSDPLQLGMCAGESEFVSRAKNFWRVKRMFSLLLSLLTASTSPSSYPQELELFHHRTPDFKSQFFYSFLLSSLFSLLSLLFSFCSMSELQQKQQQKRKINLISDESDLDSKEEAKSEPSSKRQKFVFVIFFLNQLFLFSSYPQSLTGSLTMKLKFWILNNKSKSLTYR